MKVTIREWKLKKGRCLYLDIYHQGRRVRENLNIILDGNAKFDKEKMRAAELIRARREMEYLSNIHALIADHRGEVSLVDYCREHGKSIVHDSLPRIQATFGDIQIRAVTVADVRKYQATLASKLKASTVETYLNALIAVFNHAVAERVIREAPTQGLKRIRARESAPKSLTNDELTRLEQTPIMGESGAGGQVKRAFLLACATGLRWSDCKALTWGDIRDNQVETTQVKTGDVVYVPLNDRARALIAQGDHIHPAHERVFPLLVRTAPNQYTHPWGDAAGVPGLNFHRSRHTFPRFLLDQGVDLVTVQKLMGHKKIETTARYGQASDRHKRDAVKRIDRA